MHNAKKKKLSLLGGLVSKTLFFELPYLTQFLFSLFRSCYLACSAMYLRQFHPLTIYFRVRGFSLSHHVDNTANAARRCLIRHWSRVSLICNPSRPTFSNHLIAHRLRHNARCYEIWYSPPRLLKYFIMRIWIWWNARSLVFDVLIHMLH